VGGIWQKNCVFFMMPVSREHFWHEKVTLSSAYCTRLAACSA